MQHVLPGENESLSVAENYTAGFPRDSSAWLLGTSSRTAKKDLPPRFLFLVRNSPRRLPAVLGGRRWGKCSEWPPAHVEWLMDLERHEIRFRKAVLSRLCGFQTQGCCHVGKAGPRSLRCSSLGVGLGGLIVSVTVLTRVSPSMEGNQHHRRTQFQGGFLTCGFWLLSHADLKG